MSNNSGLEFVVMVRGDPGDEDYEDKFDSEKNALLRALSVEGNVGKESDVRIGNLGHGADWSVLIMTIGSVLLLIPETHKRVREGIEEWMRIWEELRALLHRVTGDRPTFYPDEYLYGVALKHIRTNYDLDEFIFKGFIRLPIEHVDLKDREDLLFSFECEEKLYQVAINRDGGYLWENVIQL